MKTVFPSNKGSYHRAEYEDIAEIIKNLKSTATFSTPSPTVDDILEDLQASFIGLFKTKGQSFNETRFLNAIEPDQSQDQEEEREPTSFEHDMARLRDF